MVKVQIDIPILKPVSVKVWSGKVAIGHCNEGTKQLIIHQETTSTSDERSHCLCQSPFTKSPSGVKIVSHSGKQLDHHDLKIGKTEFTHSWVILWHHQLLCSLID